MFYAEQYFKNNCQGNGDKYPRNINLVRRHK